jgi:hypothetical protein
MATLDGRSLSPDAIVSSDPRWELALRVAASSSFQRSRRLRDFLLFVCERALLDPQTVVHEHEIGTTVLGRPDDFLSGEDTLVRVHASRLRKRLDQYFSTEGAAEPIVIEVPKHSYMPVFRERGSGRSASDDPDSGEGAVAAPAGADPAPAVLAGPAERRWRAVALAASAAALALLACAGWLYVDGRSLRQRAAAGIESRPTVDRLWQQMFGNGRDMYLVLADSNVTMLQDLLHRQLSPLQYQRRRFDVAPELVPKDPGGAHLVNRLMHREFTSIADAGAAWSLGRLNAAHRIPSSVISARAAGPENFKQHHAVLAGPRRGNPWIELFEDRLNFRSHFDEESGLASFENRSPAPGEERRYQVIWNELGYCRVAFLPNLDGSGSVLILSGTEMGSTEAAVDFVTSERWIRDLATTLGVGTEGRFPYFEVLLRTHLLSSASPKFELIAHRVLERRGASD